MKAERVRMNHGAKNGARIRTRTKEETACHLDCSVGGVLTFAPLFFSFYHVMNIPLDFLFVICGSGDMFDAVT